MATAFNPDEFLQNQAQPGQITMTDPSGAQASAPQPPPPMEGFDIDKFLNDGQATDELTGEKIPLGLSGNSPDTAMNRMPPNMTALDRIKLSLGNEAGNIKYLQDKFDDVKMTENGLSVKAGNTWYTVDPKNGDIKDPWARTAEYVRDALEFGPEAIGVGTGLATAAAVAPIAAGAAAMTGGVAAPAGIAATLGAAGAAGGLASAGIRASLGRAVGTYDTSNPAEVAYDLAFESLLNSAGSVIPLGVKPGARWIADNAIDPLVKAYKATTPELLQKGASAIVNSPKDAFKYMLSNFSVGQNNLDTALQNPQMLKSVMRRVDGMAGGDVAAYHDQIVREQLGSVKTIADNSRTTLSNIYGAMKNKILSAVPESFSVNLDDPVFAAYSKALDNGLATIEAGGKKLSGKEALDYMSTKGISGARFNLLSQEELAKSIQGGADLDRGAGALVADTEAYNVLKEYYKNLGQFTGGMNRSGREGAKALLDFKKVATDLSHKMGMTEAAQGSPALKQLIDGSKSQVDNQVFQAFKSFGAEKQFTGLNQTYNELSTQFSPLLRAQKQFARTGDMKSFEPLLNTFTARPGKGVTTKFAIDAAIDAAEANGQVALAKELSEQKLGIQVREAAKAFNPVSSGFLKGDKLAAGQASMLAGAYATGDPRAIAFATAIAGTGFALRSPMPAKAVVGAMNLAQQNILGVGKEILNDPQAMMGIVNGITSSPQMQQEAQQQIMQMIQQPQGPQ